MAEAIGRIERWRHASAHELRLVLGEYGDLYAAAIIRELEVIGEAAHHLSSDFKRAHPEVPWTQMYGFRTYAAHEYWDTRWAIVEEILDVHLPELNSVVAPFSVRGPIPDVIALARRAARRPMPGLRDAPERSTCGAWMPIARTYCALPRGHAGHHRSPQR